jgi:hypothetical protein
MLGLISKKKFISAVETLLRDSADNNKATDKNDLYWLFGNANAVNYICHKVGVDFTALEKKIDKED